LFFLPRARFFRNSPGMKLLVFFLLLGTVAWGQVPLRVGVVGLTHDHVHQILREATGPTIRIVGIVEPNQALAQRHFQRYGLPDSLLFSSLDELLRRARPEAVCAYGSIAEHRAVVEACAPRGVHVMVEKPLAFRLDDARAMEKLATRHRIHLLTNYETTWYASHAAAYRLLHEEKALGAVRKVVVHDGHRGPQEIGCSPEFLGWLTTPEGNGGGALIDFGCYGANLMSWLMQGQRPLAVTAVTQQSKPDVYPRVDDEATILLTYPHAQAVVQASWNWPFDRKDIEIYGQTGYAFADKQPELRIRRADQPGAERRVPAPPLPAAEREPFGYLAAVVRGQLKPAGTDLSSLPLNVLVVEILDAARQSARTGQTVRLK
jgi:predicted dehydrogenase